MIIYNMKYLIAIMLSLYTNIYSQSIPCRVDTMLDNRNKVEWRILNDTTVVLSVTINNFNIQREYYYLTEACDYLPQFITKYQNTFIFLSGSHQHYRLLTLFKLEGNEIKIDEFENDLMIDDYTDSTEKLFFMAGKRPAILILNDSNESKIKLYNQNYSLNKEEIDGIYIDNNQATVNFKNALPKIFYLEDFNEDK